MKSAISNWLNFEKCGKDWFKETPTVGLHNSNIAFLQIFDKCCGHSQALNRIQKKTAGSKTSLETTECKGVQTNKIQLGKHFFSEAVLTLGS